jgi:hypothetical protein
MRRARRAAAWALAAALAAPGCAHKLPPSGGPPDVEAPHVLATVPDSFTAGVPRDAHLSVTFSEGMEPRTSGDAVSLAPLVGIKQRKWSGRTLTVVLADTLRANQTYTMFVAPTAHDRHGNSLAGGHTSVFTTAAQMPPGAIEGSLESVGFASAGTYLWCYDIGRGHKPDSTARDFDALGIINDDGKFKVLGLPVPAQYRLWVFADLNANRSFEPSSDLLVAVDTTLALTADAPRAAGLHLKIVNPRATGRVTGTVVDSLGIGQGDLVVEARQQVDSTKVTRTMAGTKGAYELVLVPDTYHVFAFRDLDKNREWDPVREPASGLFDISLPPAAEVKDLVLVLKPAGTR